MGGDVVGIGVAIAELSFLPESKITLPYTNKKAFNVNGTEVFYENSNTGR